MTASRASHSTIAKYATVQIEGAYEMARRISVEFDVVLPDEVTEEQIQEWLEYELGQTGQMGSENPLVLCDIEAEIVSFN